jgi:hypothetical protein
MKNNYTLKTIIALMFFTAFCFNTNAQVRLTVVNPSTGEVTMHNYGGTTVDISNYQLCNFPSYNQLSSLTVTQGSLNLAAGADVTVITTVISNPNDAELGLYNSASFASSVAMQDYMQWGSAGHQREVVAVNKGIWTAGTFVNVAPPFEYTGNGGQNGAPFWDTLLGLEDFENISSFSVTPNPTNTVLNLNFSQSAFSGEVAIYNLLGKQVNSKNISNTNLATFDVSSLNSGMYIITVTSESNKESKRFIKN